VTAQRPPSPWLFALALLLGLAATALLLSPKETATPESTDAFYATARLDRFQDPGPVRVVALGSSLVSFGLDFDQDIEALGRAQGRPLRFIRFTHYGRNLDSLPPLLERIRQRPPDVLVLEADWLAWDLPPARISLRMKLKHRRRKLFQALRAVLPGGRGNAGDPYAGQEDNHAPDPGRPRPVLLPFDAGRYAQGLGQWVPRDPAQIEAILAGLDRLQQRGCRVVVLTMGRSPEAAAFFPANLAAGSQDLLDRFAARGFRVERQTCALPQSCYCDEAHLNEQGMARLSAWFLTRVADWAGARP
jgi:hypothetical protein